jgi:hypothetical protein
MKYRIVGADGKVYGPVELDQLRRWLAEGRIESRTPVFVEGAIAWTTLGALPELAVNPPGSPPAIAAVPVAVYRGTNGFATAALVCSLLSWTCCCCLPFNIMAIVFAIIALVQISSQPEPQEGRVFAIIALVLAGTSLIFGLAAGLLQLAFSPTSFNIQTSDFK